LEHPFPSRQTLCHKKVIVPWGAGGASYGDFLIQVLPKVARLLSAVPEGERSEFSVCLPFFHEQKWAIEYFTLLGIPRDRILDGSSTLRIPAGGKLIIGTGPQTYYYGISHPKDIKQFLEQISSSLPLAPEKPWRKIYVSRKTGRKMANEDELIEGLRQRDFEIVRLEELRLLDQIRLFQEARVIVGPHGAGHSNIMWSAPGSHLLEVFHPSWMHPSYAFLADLKKIHYHCLVGYHGSSRGSWRWGSYFGIFENPVIDPEIFFKKIDQLPAQ
jgi:capsular polysaccharide biosynthesis protein